jgi:uncharacterized protein YxjI
MSRKSKQSSNSPPPVTNQMVIPMAIPISGIQCLMYCNHLLIQQKTDLLEIIGIECANNYSIRNPMGQQLFHAAEESGFVMRMACGARRSFTMHIYDNANQEIIRISRPFNFCATCYCMESCTCCVDQVLVESPPGTPAGSVASLPACMYAHYAIKDVDGNQVLKVRGQMCKLCGVQEFPVYSGNDETAQVGKISKQWAGLMQEYFTNADTFGVEFPMDLDVRMKACIIAAVFLIDFMYYEESKS